MGWDTEFRSPIEIVGTNVVLKTLQDAKDVLLGGDEDTDLPPVLQNVRKGLRLAAERQRPKDLSDATRATLSALHLAGVEAIMDTSSIGRAPKERPKLAIPKSSVGTARARRPSKVPDVQETLRNALARATALKE